MSEKEIRIGMVVRADATGLGNQSQDWVMNLPIKKVLIAWGEKPANPEIYSHLENRICEMGTPNLDEIDWLLKDIDLVLTIETPYNWNLIKKAKERGIKSIIAPNYEWLPIDVPEQPDLWLCYNILNFQFVPFPNKVYVPQPINRPFFPFKKRKKARVFLFNNGNGGAWGRNCLHEFIEAINFVKSDVKFIINSQVPFEAVNDSRVETHYGDLPITDIWKEGDVFIHLRKFGALSLPQNEAMSLGLPVIGVNRFPENVILPSELLIEPDGVYPHQCRKDVMGIEANLVNPLKIAAKIDELANTDITKYSEMMDKQADAWSWEKQRPNWLMIFSDLVNNKLTIQNNEHQIPQAEHKVDEEKPKTI